MKLTESLQRAYDWHRPNRYALKRYLLKDGKTHPFALICPGGGYQLVCSYGEGLPYAKALNARGYHAFVVYYRTKELARYPHPHEDLHRAIEEVFAHAAQWKLETEGWSLWGSSAGGHLAASYCTEDRGTPKPAALILSYPVVSLGACTHPGTRDNLLGENADPAMVGRLSIERHIGADYPPTYVWNGTADSLVDPVNSRLLEKALADAGVPHMAEEFEGVDHGAGLAQGTNAADWLEHAVAFWEAQRRAAGETA